MHGAEAAVCVCVTRPAPPRRPCLTYRRRFLNDLLVAPLQTAVALVEVDGVALHVRKDLHLHVARPANVLFNQARVVAKVLAGLALVCGSGEG